MNNIETSTILEQAKNLNEENYKLKDTSNRMKAALQNIQNILGNIDPDLKLKIAGEIEEYNSLTVNEIDRLFYIAKTMKDWAEKTDNIENDLAAHIQELNNNSEKIQKMINLISD